MNIDKEQKGFTLIEVLMAMAIFTIGILGVFGMQTAAIKENLSANSMTTGSAWATDQVEKIIALDYGDLDKTKSCADLASADWWKNTDSKNTLKKSDLPVYTVYQEVAMDCAFVYANGKKIAEEYRPKHIRVAVTKGSGAAEKLTAEFEYIKQYTTD